ncbi:oxidoreductase [Nocardia sp. NPDC056000]|uniref:oxidoreductase n=1 Tax=Nocardia sp. NPDC056000 TaxID=3345674 RepID=UPI0035D6AA4B
MSNRSPREPGAAGPWTAADIPDLTGSTAVVTGASAGLGAETARQLAARGARVVLACRSVDKGECVAASIRQRSPDAELSVVQVDLASLASVRGAAAWVRERFDRVDLLVNNAGTLFRDGPHKTVDGFEPTFATNHLGHFAFTGLLLDLLTAAPAGRVVAVSSRAAGYRRTVLDLGDLTYERRAYKPMFVYGQSKLANLLFAFELQRRLADAGASLIALAAYPGVADSDFNKNLGGTARFLARPEMRWFSQLLTQTTAMGALPTLRACTDPSMNGGDYIGPNGRTKGHPVRREPAPRALDRQLATDLWAESERLTGVVYPFPLP